MPITPKEQAIKMWKIYCFYYLVPDELEAKQRLVLQCAEISRVLLSRGLDEHDYWNEVGKEIYEI